MNAIIKKITAAVETGHAQICYFDVKTFFTLADPNDS
jgi:hypothetical protein